MLDRPAWRPDAAPLVTGQQISESAHRLGVDPSTLAKWERGEREPAGEYMARAERFLATVEALCPSVRTYDRAACIAMPTSLPSLCL